MASSSANKLLFCCRMSVKRRSSEDAVILRLNVDVSTTRQVFLKPFTSFVSQSVTSGLGKHLEKTEYSSFNALFRSKSAQENCFTHVQFNHNIHISSPTINYEIYNFNSLSLQILILLWDSTHGLQSRENRRRPKKSLDKCDTSSK